MRTRAIETEGLMKVFGDVIAVDSLDLEVDRGEVFGLIGPNGSGKTTTIRMLCGLLRPSGGRAWVLGRRVPDRRVMQAVGYMPQGTSLYLDNTVAENMALFGGIFGLSPAEMDARTDELLRLVDLEDRRDAVVSTLSGGMRHRVSLACALVHRPRLLFLDEPTVGVDPVLRSGFWRHFMEMARDGITVVITTHYMDEASHCSRVGLMRRGRLIAVGAPVELRERTGAGSLEDAFLELARREDR